MTEDQIKEPRRLIAAKIEYTEGTEDIQQAIEEYVDEEWPTLIKVLKWEKTSDFI